MKQKKQKYKTPVERFYDRYTSYIPRVAKHLNMRAAADLAARLFQPDIKEAHWTKPTPEEIYDANVQRIQKRINRRGL